VLGVDTGTSGTIYLDDYDSRRFSSIGQLPDPETSTTPAPIVNWINKVYTYGDSSHKHAVTGVVVTDENNNQTADTYRYDADGRGLCTPEWVMREGQHDLPQRERRNLLADL